MTDFRQTDAGEWRRGDEGLVRVPMPALLALRGPMPTIDADQLPEAAPLCAGFSGVAR